MKVVSSAGIVLAITLTAAYVGRGAGAVSTHDESSSKLEVVQTGDLPATPACFVPNLGQWDHPARFVRRNGAMTLLLEDRGWVIDLVERARGGSQPEMQGMPPLRPDPDTGTATTIRGVSLRMSFEGGAQEPGVVGENKLSGHHNYFLGNERSRWKTGVPLFAAVRYVDLYPGIDVRMHDRNGVPEYDLLLQPGADLSAVSVRVDGAREISIAQDGSLVIETELGPLVQPKPTTWEVNRDGRRSQVACDFAILGKKRFGFSAPNWSGDTSLTVDPALLWSTFLGGAGDDVFSTVSVDQTGAVTVAGQTESAMLPTTTGAYTAQNQGSNDIFVGRFDPTRTGSNQLVFATFLGGSANDLQPALAVSPSGVVTVAGHTLSTDFPTTVGALDTTHKGVTEAFVSRLDPSKTGSAQLAYSTYLGGDDVDRADAVQVEGGVITLSGTTRSANFATTANAFDRTFNGGNLDVFVARIDPNQIGNAQLVYSTFIGGSGGTGTIEDVTAIATDLGGIITLTGRTQSTDYPVTSGAYDVTHNGGADAYVSQLDIRRIGSSQLIYSTFVGGSDLDAALDLGVDGSGVITLGGWTKSASFPTTAGAFDAVHDRSSEGFISRLDPSKSGPSQLVYSTFLGGDAGSKTDDVINAVSVDSNKLVTVAGYTWTPNFPTTAGAFDTSHNGGSDAFVSQLDLNKVARAQLVYSTFIGGSNNDYAFSFIASGNGEAALAGMTWSSNFPTSPGAFQGSNGGRYDFFLSQISMQVAEFSTFGSGCASSSPLPTVSGTPPKLGQSFDLDISGFLRKPQFGQLIFGASNDTWGLIRLPLPLGVLSMPNCQLLVSLDTSSLIVTDAQGSFSTTIGVPSSTSLLGAEVFGQAWAPDPQANGLGVAMTNAFKAVVGY